MNILRNSLLFSWCLFLIAFCSYRVQAQGGSTFDEFKLKITPYFADELIDDIRRTLPQNKDYKVWGWDVGDFSGDGYNDLACAVQTVGVGGKRVKVYLFVDIDGYLTSVGTFDYTYLELPIEIGILIRNSSCRILQKIKKDVWTSNAYRFTSGALVVTDTLQTRKDGKQTRETYRNYTTLEGYERFFREGTKTPDLEANFLCIPSYQRGRRIYQGYTKYTYSDRVKFVPKGAYYWTGADDASMRVRSAFDDDYLYFVVYVKDDSVVAEQLSSNAFDRLEVWLDCARLRDRFITGQDFRTVADSGIFSFSMNPGNFTDIRASVNISTTDELSDTQNTATEDVKVVSSLTDSGYVMKLRVPFVLLGYDGPPLDGDKVQEFGCTVVTRDIDNKYRPEEETLLATSVFDRSNPATFGALLFLPERTYYGKSENIYLESILNRLQQVGY